jgi:uncharacterized repeat protein (TIGR01451 family)
VVEKDSWWVRSNGRRFILLCLVIGSWFGVLPPSSRAETLPAGFQDSVLFSGLTEPTSVEYAPDGRIFVAEKSGLIKVFDDVYDPAPTVFADLRNNVHNFWDRGLLGLALDPSFPSRPYVYALYTFDAPIGGTAPTWGTPGGTSDACPTPPGPTADGCVVSGRLSRLTASGDVMTGTERVLVEDWCQQYPSHSVGDIAFGADGALYASAGEGASYFWTDYGQDGNPLNPCGDPPAGVGGQQTTPTAEGGSLRSQDLRTSGDPAGLSGSIIRVDPNTGAGLSGNPLFSSTDPNARRIIASGLRNPFRFAMRPGTNEVWVGDVGYVSYDEIDRVPAPGGPIENFGWPCYEGGKDASGNPNSQREAGFDAGNLDICENLYTQGPDAVNAPYFSYAPSEVLAGESCPSGSSTIAGLAFEPQSGVTYPPTFRGALFFGDYSRGCIWTMRLGANGLPDPATRATFADGAANPVDLEIGPGGDILYVDFRVGTVHRISYAGGGNQPPAAVLGASPHSGPAPLTVSFNATDSSDPDPGDSLTYAWDLDGDGSYDDSHASQPSHTYPAGSYTVRLRVTDSRGASSTATTTINSSESPPTATISTPVAGTTWKVGDVIGFSGSATDQQDGPLPASAFRWTLELEHCPSSCHVHAIQSFDGVANGSFVAPDHDYPSYLDLRLTATDSAGLQDTKTLRLDPRTVALTFESSPTTLQLVVGGTTSVTPFSRRVIVGSNNSISAPEQTYGNVTYAYPNWSDGGAQTHQVVAPATAASYTAAFTPIPQLTFSPGQDARVEEARPGTNFGTSVLRTDGGADPDVETYLRFGVTDINGPVQSAKLRLFPNTPTVDGPAAYLTGTSWSESGITWSNRAARTSGATDDKAALAAAVWAEWNVTPLVTGNGTYSFALATTSTDGITFASREDASSALWPQLIVSYVGGSDLSLTKTGSPNPVAVGRALTYTLTVHNAGPWHVGAGLTDTLPKSVRFRSAASTQGNCAFRPPRTVDCNLTQMSSGGSAVVTIVVRPTRRGAIVNTARVRSFQTDTDSQNDRAAAVTTVN